jgi:hypothetical protein
VTPLSSLLKKRLKNKKMKFGIKMYCLKIKGIDYLIIKKAGGIKIYFIKQI